MKFKFANIEYTTETTTRERALTAIKGFIDLFESAVAEDESHPNYWTADPARQNGRNADNKGVQRIYNFYGKDSEYAAGYVVFYKGNNGESLAICSSRQTYDYAYYSDSFCIRDSVLGSPLPLLSAGVFLVFQKSDFDFDGIQTDNKIIFNTKNAWILPTIKCESAYGSQNVESEIFKKSNKLQFGIGIDNKSIIILGRTINTHCYKISVIGDVFTPIQVDDNCKLGVVSLQYNRQSNSISDSGNTSFSSEGIQTEISDNLSNPVKTSSVLDSSCTLDKSIVSVFKPSDKTPWTTPTVSLLKTTNNIEESNGIINGLGFKGYINSDILKYCGGYKTVARGTTFLNGTWICPNEPEKIGNSQYFWIIPWDPSNILPDL